MTIKGLGLGLGPWSAKVNSTPIGKVVATIIFDGKL
jgi:hypothetical protein